MATPKKDEPQDERKPTAEEQAEKERAELNANDIETLPPPDHRAEADRRRS